MERLKRLLRGEISDRTSRILKIIAVVVLLVMLFVMAVSQIRGTKLSNVRDSYNNFFSSVGGGGGFPYQVNSSNIKKVDVLNGDIYILYNDRSVAIDGSAKELRSFDHSFATPALSMSPDRVLIYDRGGNAFRVENRTESLYEGKTSDGENIITASIGKKGNIAFGTLSGSATSRLTVWNSTYDKKAFVWNCSDYSITSTALGSSTRCDTI